ncbi:DUF2937 family protein [uncultured Rhodospira sp.]|uniref:DUF2937 family protein n=1 Tax=uncultured Rhodospira sp. TaxID=1936189 RepID=UPI00262F4614|nr:DUF2937 family protein [uncultured Rhodospira sp.]
MPVGWALRKLDSLGGAAVAAVGGGAASQWRAYLQQYLQRLGGHADEARLSLEGTKAHVAEIVDVVDPAQKAVLSEMLRTGEARVSELTEALRAIAEAGPVLQPVAFLRHMDPAIARATLDGFQPALPLDATSLIWAGAGIVLTLVAYELVKGILWTPVAVTKGMARKRRRRPARDGRDARKNTRRRAAPERVEPRL